MTPRHAFNVFFAAARLGFKQTLGEGLPLLGSLITYGALVIAYASMFRWIPAEDLAARGLNFVHLIWYLGATEFLLFCISFGHFRELQYEIQSDQIHLALLRPCPVWIVKVSEWCGQFLARFAALALPSYAILFAAAGNASPDLSALAGFVASLPLAGFLLVASGFLVGSSCLWLGQAEPTYWLWQKSLFLLGAMLWPLALYPEALRVFAWLTPFPSMLAVAGEWMLDLPRLSRLTGFLHQGLWVLVVIAATAKLNRALLRRIQGGDA